ncbi:GNAT family N-acetyltransferase [Mucilaginibacter xinganensis]|uniref:GNAT family N-acetyltransferase n=1 Tax=Mucilaginibacter xinganensis TaxID=1234841 RepID=A0A223P0G2_9SPHI|nr:GNAT family N-acetyltransferase [Mucilaginibacter xinganensis]ASU35613.1 GNAT family N-acetyltransferase [Mucilaginibacter xinganensis]
MQIKRITISDYHLVIPLFNSYRVFYKQPSDLDLAGHFIKSRLQNNESVIFAALTNDNGEQTPAGFTQLYPLLSSVKATRNWLLNDLFVDAAFRKQGIGEALIKMAMEFAGNNGATYLKLETAADNYTAQSLYEAIGFVKKQAAGSFLVYQIQL